MAWSFVASSGAFAGDAKVDFELGHQSSVLTDGQISRNRYYATFAAQAVFGVDAATGSSWELNGMARGWADIDNDAQIRALNLTRTTEHLKVKLGFQEVAWGETFGFPISDLVNPRDLSDPLFLELEWVRRPVFAANAVLSVGSFRLQGVATPFPVQSLLPARGSAYDPLPAVTAALPLRREREFAFDRVGQDVEAGGRMGYLFGGGFDVSLLYFYYWNRNPVIETIMARQGPYLRQVVRRTHTAGLGMSKTLGDFVLRADGLLHLDQPVQAVDLGKAAVANNYQVVVGTDVNLEGDWTLGAQYEHDRAGDRLLHWASARVQKGFFDRALEPELLGFAGIGNSDVWVQPKITWNFLENYSVQLRGDFVFGSLTKDAGVLGPIEGRHRLMLWVRAKI